MVMCLQTTSYIWWTQSNIIIQMDTDLYAPDES